MHPSFWHDRWQNQQIGFHEGQANALLVEHFRALRLTAGQRVFVPLCGKTRDIAWLLAAGMRVVGAELSELAIRQLFDELGVDPEIATTDRGSVFRGPDVEIFVGDLFDLAAADLGTVDAVYDRAALVALSEDLRARYVVHVPTITGGAPQLLLTLDYDPNCMDGPPFSIRSEEVRRHYGDRYELQLLARVEVPGKLKGQCRADECAWLLTP